MGNRTMMLANVGSVVVGVAMILLFSWIGWRVSRWMNWKLHYGPAVERRMESIEQRIEKLEKNVDADP